ncbi:MAG: hypothetical protein RMJ28_00310 [Nitrososphaerota archaeon]|nr:hypothetical protein [Nitrososphaerota archaeon]
MNEAVDGILNKLDTMNKPLEEVFMGFIQDAETLSIPFSDSVLLHPQSPPGEWADFWEEREYSLQGVAELDGPVLSLSRGQPLDVVAVDASIVRVAESRLGTVVGLRAAVVHRSGGVSVEVFGPFLRLIKSQSPASLGHEAREELRYFERMVQLWVLANIRAGIYLFDGTLAAWYERAGGILDSILDLAEYSSRAILAFSKESLLMRGWQGVGLEDGSPKPPYVRDLTEAAKTMWSGLRPICNIYLARLTPALHELRVDAYPPGMGIDALSSLISSDALIHGYPETLILAHAHAAFSWMDVVALKGALLGNKNPAVSSIFSPRLTVLTPFETRRYENPT